MQNLTKTIGVLLLVSLSSCQITLTSNSDLPEDSVCKYFNITCPHNQVCYLGACSPNCNVYRCQPGFICNQYSVCEIDPNYCRSDQDCKEGQMCYFGGVCKDKCSLIMCPAGKVCRKGECVQQKICDDFQMDVLTEIKSCSSPRLIDRSCNEYSNRKPQFCGITNNGARISFDEECQICNNYDVEYYFNEPCHKAPFVCEDSQTCTNNYCSGRCINSCPYNWQLCIEGQCVDECKYLNCEKCKYGKCVYNENGRPCEKESDCFNSELSCVNNICTDLCTHKKCGNNQNCFKGECYSTFYH